MATAYLCLGSNLGSPILNLSLARSSISKLGGTKIVTESSIYRTEPVGYTDQPWFHNQVIKISTGLSAEQLFLELEKIEVGMGKTKEFKDGPRNIDLDILFYDGLVLSTIVEGKELVIPHKQAHLRKFVLVPLNDIAPEFLHPILNQSIQTILTALSNVISAKTVIKH